jgi:hypothetical protein
VTFFGEIATMGTILIALTYLVANLALPVFYHRYERERFSTANTCCYRCWEPRRSAIRSLARQARTARAV